jgi:molecular chaperone DnaK
MFNLVGIPPAPRGVPQIEVAFDIDANGILNVSAKDMATGNVQKITITASTKLSDSDKERMVKEAEQFAEQDKMKKEEADARNNADSLVYTAEKTKKDLKEKLNKDQVDKIDKAISELKDALSGKDVGKIKTKTEDLTKIVQEIGAAVYQQAARQQPQQKPSGQTGTNEKPKTGEKVVDADYEVVDEGKK